MTRTTPPAGAIFCASTSRRSMPPGHDPTARSCSCSTSRTGRHRPRHRHCRGHHRPGDRVPPNPIIVDATAGPPWTVTDVVPPPDPSVAMRQR
jgi:hypothetical protein